MRGSRGQCMGGEGKRSVIGEVDIGTKLSYLNDEHMFFSVGLNLIEGLIKFQALVKCVIIWQLTIKSSRRKLAMLNQPGYAKYTERGSSSCKPLYQSMYNKTNPLLFIAH